MKSQSIGFLALLNRLRNLFSKRNWLTSPANQRQARSIFIRHVDAGSSNDCELEIAALSNPIYDLERFGFHIVASPRHADILLVTSPLTRNMKTAVLTAFQAMPEPRQVVTVGNGFQEDNPFYNSYATLPLPEELALAQVKNIPGDPPSPQQILDYLLGLETQ